MEFSSSILSTLRLIGSEDALSEKDFKKLIRVVFDSFTIDGKLGSFNLDLDKQNLGNFLNEIDSQLKLQLNLKIKDGIEKSPEEIKDLTSALLILIAEFAKNDASLKSVSSFLEDIGFSNEKIQSFTENYQVLLILKKFIIFDF